MARCRSAGALDKPAANKVRLAAGVVTPWPFGLLKADVDIDAYRAFLRSRITVMAVSADVSKPPSASIQSACVRCATGQPAINALTYVRF
jgi:hypothetical protein